MRKAHIIQVSLLLSGFLLVLFLFKLPKYIVDKNETTGLSAPESSKHQETSGHSNEELDTERIQQLTTLLIKPENSEKKAIFADSIAQTYRKVMLFDSSAKYFSLAATLNTSLETNKIAASGVFEAFQNTMVAEDRKSLGLKAIGFLEKILIEEPSNIDAQIKKAVALVYTEPMPMGGIGLLKDIIENNPTNIEARLYLGEFQFTVGKIDKAIEQFSIVHELNPMDFKALLYLADGYISLGKKVKAEKYISKIRALESTDPYIQSVLKQFEEELKKL